MTREEFIDDFCRLSGMPPVDFFRYGDAVTCACSSPQCQGWRYETRPMSEQDWVEFFDTKPLRPLTASEWRLLFDVLSRGAQSEYEEQLVWRGLNLDPWRYECLQSASTWQSACARFAHIQHLRSLEAR
jgi:hypothetical protein